VKYLLSDLDPLDTESPEEGKARYLGQLNNGFAPVPTVMVDSGNGIQCLWKLDQPIVLDGDARVIAEVEARSKALMERLGAKAGTQNIDRILRLPGTKNLPNKVKRGKGRRECPTKLLWFNGVRYGLDTFPVPEKKGPGPTDDRGPRKDDAHGEGEDKLERIIRLGENGEFDGDRSRAVWWAINEMLRRGCVDGAIASTLLDRANKTRNTSIPKPSHGLMPNDRSPRPTQNITRPQTQGATSKSRCFQLPNGWASALRLSHPH
jgi:hypothetical protein